jgi:PAS domain-containing protein
MNKNSDFYDINFKNFPIGILIINDDKIVYKNTKMEEFNINSLDNITNNKLPDISTNFEISLPFTNQPVYVTIIPYKLQNETTHLLTFKKSQDQEDQIKNLEKKLILLSENIHRSNELFKCIETEINMGILKTNSEGIIEYHNEIFENMTHQFLIGKCITDIMPDHNQKRELKYILENKINGNMIFKLNINEDHFVWLKFKIIYNENHGFVITVKDVTYKEETISKLLEIKLEVKKIVDEEFRKA